MFGVVGLLDLRLSRRLTNRAATFECTSWEEALEHPEEPKARAAPVGSGASGRGLGRATWHCRWHGKDGLYSFRFSEKLTCQMSRQTPFFGLGLEKSAPPNHACATVYSACDVPGCRLYIVFGSWLHVSLVIIKHRDHTVVLCRFCAHFRAILHVTGRQRRVLFRFFQDGGQMMLRWCRALEICISFLHMPEECPNAGGRCFN